MFGRFAGSLTAATSSVARPSPASVLAASQQSRPRVNDNLWSSPKALLLAGLLPFRGDVYGGTIIEIPDFIADDSRAGLAGDGVDGSAAAAEAEGAEAQRATIAALERTVAHLERSADSRGVWLRLHRKVAGALLPAALRLQFDFHHAEPPGDHTGASTSTPGGFVTLARWMPTDVPSPLPSNASHTVGVGAIVMHPGSGNHILLVQERLGPAAGGIWKLPTGQVHAGEDLPEAVVRETWEETGVVTKFEGLVCISHGHNGPLQTGCKSEMFVVAKCSVVGGDTVPRLLRSDEPSSTVSLSQAELESHSATQITVCPTELRDAQWIDWDTAMAQPFRAEGSLYAELYRTCYDACLRGAPLIAGRKLPLVFRPGEAYLYSAI